MGLITYGAVLQNEVKGWPARWQIGSGFDLVTNNQWWDDEGTPTTKATAVPSSGEAGLDAKFLEIIKCVTDAADEGFVQRYTYADEPRIKSGSVISALVWVATTSGGSGITAKLRNSGGSSTSGTSVATDGDWTLLAIEEHTCSGTYVELVITKDASGTFYAGGPITVMIGADAIALPPRKEVFRHYNTTTVVEDLSGSSGKATGDVDLTSITSPLATRVGCHVDLYEPSTGQFAYSFRPNGGGWTMSIGTGAGFKAFVVPSETERQETDFEIVLDDLQIIETGLFNSGGGTTDYARFYMTHYWEWE